MYAILVKNLPRILILSPLVTVLAFIGETTADPAAGYIDSILKTGPIGFVLALILLDKLDTTGERNLLRTQVAESQERERKLYENIKNDLAPALVENTKLISDTIKPLLDRVIAALERDRR